MDKRSRLLTVLLSLALLVSLTMACIPGLPGLGGEVTEETPAPPPPPAAETPISGARCGDGVCDGPENPANCPQDCPPPAGETPEPPPPPEELPFDMDVDALGDLDSYAFKFHLEGASTAEGTVEHVTLDIEGQRQSRPTRAEQLSFSSVTDDDTTSMEIVYIEDLNKIWTREGGGQWEELPVMDPAMLQMFDAFSMVYWWDMLFTGDPGDAQYLGQEVVNGVQSHHYRTAETATWGFTQGCTFASAQDDLWVAVDGSFPVKRQFDAAGECQGESGEVHFLMELSNVNQPVNITPPI
jgi:hypothetical protein